MGNEAPSKSVDDIAVKGVAAKVQELFSAQGTFLAFPLAPVAYLAEDLRFLAPGGLSAVRAQTLGEFSELVNRLPIVSQVWADDGSGRHLWDVYEDLLGAELATSERTTAEEQAYQRAYGYLHTVMPEPPDPPSQVLLEYQSGRSAYLAAEAAWKNGKEGIRANELGAAKDQAWQDWKIVGHKDDVEEANLTLSTLSDKDPSVAWSRYRTQFDPQMPASFQTSLNGMRYVTTGFAPSGVLDVPWARMSMDRNELDSAAGGASPELAKSLADSSTTGKVKAVSFEFMAVDVTRPWFDSSMLASRAWRFRSGIQPLSDGGSPPLGRCPAFVTKLILARNISVTRTKPAEGGGGSAPTMAFIEPFQAQLLEASPILVSPPAVEPPPVVEDPPIVEVEPPPVTEIIPPVDGASELAVDETTLVGESAAQTNFGIARLSHASEMRRAVPLRSRFRGISDVTLGANRLKTAFGAEERAISVEQQAEVQPKIERRIENIQMFDFPVAQLAVPETLFVAPPASPEDEVVTTPADVIFVMAFGCRLIGTAPNPDLGLPWPTA